MNYDVYKLMFLSIACNLDSDAAFYMLNEEYIKRFAKQYASLPAKDKPSVLDAMISYTLRELPIIASVDQSIVYTLRSKRDAIVHDFICCSTSEMITRLAVRDTIQEKIRTFLRKENNQATLYTKINSSRVNDVFSWFFAVFKDNCAHAFQFVGSFENFVMNCFIQFFYKGRKKDIWIMIKEVDTARREVEQSIVQEKILHRVRTDDVPIHDLIVNISLVDDLLFKHSGQSDDARGVQYDIYYLILCELCRRKVDEINEALGEDILLFVDPYDRRENYLGVPPNKGIAAKVSNAKELIPPVFDYVREGKFNTSNLQDLRDTCFKLGKHDREGRNCVWEDVVAGGETSRYLDTPTAMKNYSSFDQIVKGVISVYTLMTELEARGKYLVDNYVPDLFRDKDIVRYIDYLSSVPCIQLMKTLQREPVDYARYGRDLYEFDQMVDVYAGSAVNNHTNIRENRYYAITHGFLDKPRLKQTSVLTTRFDKLRVVAQAMDALPRSYQEYLTSLDANRFVEYEFDDYIALPSGDVVAGKFTEPYCNSFVVGNPDAAAYYLRGNRTSGEGTLEQSLHALGWSVGSGSLGAINFGGAYGLYLPLHFKFMFYDCTSHSAVQCQPWNMLYSTIRDRARCGLVANGVFEPVRCVGHMAEYAKKLSRTIGFSYEVGISNICALDVPSRVKDMNIAGMYKKYMTAYFVWLDENSRMQHSIMDVLRTIYTEVVFLLWWAKDDSTKIREYQYAKSLLDGLCTGEFDTESLDWILSEIDAAKNPVMSQWSRDPQKLSNPFRPMDRSVLDYVFGRVSAKDKNIFVGALNAANAEATPASKFIAIYNYVYTKLEFLRYIRDAYSLLIDTTAIETSTLVCELNQRFKVEDELRSYAESPISYGARTEQMDYESVKRSIWETRSECLNTFATLVNEVTEYVKECEGEIAKLISYGIAAQTSTRSKFSECGQAFAILPDYPAIHELQELRRRANTDSAGFFMLDGSYFQGHNGGKTYYVHRSGRMVAEDNGGFWIAEFNFEKPEDKRKYADIITSGLM